MKKLALSVVIALSLGACSHTDDPPPRIEIREVIVERPVPCGALSELGEEPAYPDTDEALAAATGIGPLAQLYRNGRAMRNARLEEYQTARRVCETLEPIAE